MIEYLGFGIFLLGMGLEIFAGTFQGLIFLYGGIITILIGLFLQERNRNV